MKRFEGKVALVTGGRTGIGQAISRRFEAEGARVYSAQRSADEERESIEADFAEADAPARVVEAVLDRAGQLDVLINGSGVMQEATVEEMSLDDWTRTLTVNLTAPFLMIKAALPALKERTGTIVNIGSVEGLGSNPGHAAYCASKAGLQRTPSEP